MNKPMILSSISLIKITHNPPIPVLDPARKLRIMGKRETMCLIYEHEKRKHKYFKLS
jgi:hypothetical protein